MGRPTKLTPELQADLIEALEHGMHQESACNRVGIAKATFYKWMERGRNEPESIYGDLVDAVEKARARPEAEALSAIHAAWRDGTWQAAAWFLERSHPQKYGRINRTEISGPEGEPIKVETNVKQVLLDKLGLDDSAD